jgi:serine/threonine protein phosphatase PrpC
MSRAERDSGEINATADEVTTSQPGDRPATSASGIVVRCAGRTAVGQVRDHNEDNFVVANLATGEVQPRDEVFEDEIGDRGLIFAVCDGMGGAAAGEVASQMAVDILVEAMRRGGPPKNRDGLARRLVSAVEEAGRRIFDAAQRERSRRGMGTTATVAVLVDRVMFLAEVGDSRAYLLRGGELRQLTKDQSLVNQLIEAGHLTEDEAEAFEHSNIILQALGTSETVQVDLTFVELRRGDRLLVCSDGLSGLLHVDTLRSTLEELRDPAECSAKLIEYAETAGGHDNITVVVADFDGEGLPHAQEGEAFGYVQYPLPMADHDSSAFVLGETVRVGRRPRARDDDTPDGAIPLARIVSESPAPPISRSIAAGTYVRWVMGVVIVLSLAGLIWIRLQTPPSDDGASFQASPGPAQPAAIDEADAPALANKAAPEPDAIDVNVHTDVEHATLFVNGEPKGTLSAETSRSIKLRPGAYRFEAQSAGSPMAHSVVTVKGDVPVDVFLKMPKGASDVTGVGGSHAAAPVPPPLPAAALAEPTAPARPARTPSSAAGQASKGGHGARSGSAAGATSARPERSRRAERSLSSARARQRARARQQAAAPAAAPGAAAPSPAPAQPEAAPTTGRAGSTEPPVIPGNPF